MSPDVEPAALDRAADAIRDGDLVVYPTETVYGLGADATNTGAIETVYEAKRRDRDRPISLAVPTIEAASRFAQFGQRERAFMEQFLPGPVTVVCERREGVPDVLTATRERVGIRIPDHPVARALLERVAPLTATSANVSGTGSVRRPGELSASVRGAVRMVLDDGTTPGGGSTVVDVANRTIHRRGTNVDAVETWLDTH
ncbi:MAG: L-threonylcarbamoyladenylate synthase [Halobacteriaceae archaeon]